MYIPMEEGEEIIKKVHRHWLFVVSRVLGLAVLLVAPSVLVTVLENMGIIELSGVSIAAHVVLWALWGLVLWVMFWQFWTTYFMDVWVITNKRIIDVDYIRLFERNISILRYDRIQDIATKVQGLIGTLLKYGTVVVQTAGSDKEFIIDQVAHPDALRDLISARASEAMHPRV